MPVICDLADRAAIAPAVEGAVDGLGRLDVVCNIAGVGGFWHDIGFPIHLASVEGQIEGATAMSIGQALCEQVVFDNNGRTMNPSFVDYLMPTINMMPRIETTLVDGYPGSGPYGAKGAGEIACVPPMAAIANAIFNATGVRIRTLPLSPENVFRALREAGKA